MNLVTGACAQDASITAPPSGPRPLWVNATYPPRASTAATYRFSWEGLTWDGLSGGQPPRAPSGLTINRCTSVTLSAHDDCGHKRTAGGDEPLFRILLADRSATALESDMDVYHGIVEHGRLGAYTGSFQFRLPGRYTLQWYDVRSLVVEITFDVVADSDCKRSAPLAFCSPLTMMRDDCYYNGLSCSERTRMMTHACVSERTRTP
eukprot:1193815-Prorocentrum_minimum.AAC.3